MALLVMLSKVSCATSSKLSVLFKASYIPIRCFSSENELRTKKMATSSQYTVTLRIFLKTQSFGWQKKAISKVRAIMYNYFHR